MIPKLSKLLLKIYRWYCPYVEEPEPLEEDSGMRKARLWQEGLDKMKNHIDAFIQDTDVFIQKVKRLKKRESK